MSRSISSSLSGCWRSVLWTSQEVSTRSIFNSPPTNPTLALKGWASRAPSARKRRTALAVERLLRSSPRAARRVSASRNKKAVSIRARGAEAMRTHAPHPVPAIRAQYPSPRISAGAGVGEVFEMPHRHGRACRAPVQAAFRRTRAPYQPAPLCRPLQKQPLLETRHARE